MYCSIEEAFQSVVSPDKQPSARRSKRHKSGVLVSGFQNPPKISAPPAIPPQLPPPETDPDRPALPPAPAQYIGGGTGANNGAAAPMMGTDKPMFYSNILTAVDQDASYPAFPHPNDDMEGAERAYMLEPDWTTQFKGSTVPSWIRDRLASKSAEIPLKDVEPTWMDGESTLWQRIPASYAPATPLAPASAPSASNPSEDRLKALDQKLDRMFAKLDEINKAKAESNHLEIIMFIRGGLFLLLMLDMLVKQGVRATAMLAATAGGAMRTAGGGLYGF